MAPSNKPKKQAKAKTTAFPLANTSPLDSGNPTASDVQSPAPSRQSPGCRAVKAKPSRALLDGLVGLRARLALNEALSRALQPRLYSTQHVDLHVMCSNLILSICTVFSHNRKMKILIHKKLYYPRCRYDKRSPQVNRSWRFMSAYTRQTHLWPGRRPTQVNEGPQ